MSAIEDKSIEIFERKKSKKNEDDDNEQHVKCKFKFQ